MGSGQSIQPFDWYRIFVGDQTGPLFLLEVVFRTVVMYGYALVFARVVGKRAVGQISPFEFILIIIISSAAGDPMFYAHVPLLHGFVVLTAVMVLHRVFAHFADLSERVEDVLEGEPLLVVKNGELLERAVESASISRRELLMKLRRRSIRDVGEVEVAFLEPDGELSVLRASPDMRKSTESTMPRDYKPRHHEPRDL